MSNCSAGMSMTPCIHNGSTTELTTSASSVRSYNSIVPGQPGAVSPQHRLHGAAGAVSYPVAIMNAWQSAETVGNWTHDQPSIAL